MNNFEIRKKFSIPDDVVYFNCSYMGPQLKSATEKAKREVEKKQTPWVYTKEDFFDQVYILQTNLAKLLHTQPENIALTPSVSYGISTAAQGVLYYCDPGEIIVLDQQFPSNIYPWMDLKKQGFSLKVVQRNRSEDLTKQVISSLSSKTKVVALGQCHWADGHMLDLNILGKELKRRNIVFVVDGIQSVGVIPKNVEDSQVSYFSGGMYKWLLGPYGLSYLYVNNSFCEGPSLDATWMSRVGSDDFSNLTVYNDALIEGAGRYHMGGKSSFTHIAIANEAIEFLLSLGIKNIESEVRAKTDRLAGYFENKGFELIPREFRAPHVLSIQNSQGQWSQAFQDELVRRKVYVSFRGSSMRISPNVFNTDQDFALFTEAMNEVL